jgi:hypothetical protein
MDEREMIVRWVRHWQDAGPELEAIRRAEVRDADNPQVLALLETAFNQALRSRPMRMTSGLVEMQVLFAKLRK